MKGLQEMSEEKYEQQSECSHDCSHCSSSCSQKKPSKEELLEPMNQYSDIKRVIGVVSGKGGVGKSFVTSYLSVLMNRKGYQTAILDADVTGPSIPKAFGLHEKATGTEFGIMPVLTENNIKVMSVNLLLDDEEAPVVWRGPIIAGTVKQFWTEVVWGDVDYMFVDMPPGTGDVPLTVFQSLPLDGIIIVTSPQDLVSMIVAKAVNMANMMGVPVLGLVENYSYVECPDCKKHIEVFGHSHIDEVSAKFGIPVLAKLPIDPDVATKIDLGKAEEIDKKWLDDAAGIIEEALPSRSKSFDMKSVKIAVTADDSDNVYGHFGTAKKFRVYNFENGSLKSKEVVDNAGEGHSSTIDKLLSLNVNVVICGGIGGPAMQGLMNAGVLVVPGATGDIDVAVNAFIDGSLKADTAYTCNCEHTGECECHEGEEK